MSADHLEWIGLYWSLQANGAPVNSMLSKRRPDLTWASALQPRVSETRRLLADSAPSTWPPWLVTLLTSRVVIPEEHQRTLLNILRISGELAVATALPVAHTRPKLKWTSAEDDLL